MNTERGQRWDDHRIYGCDGHAVRARGVSIGDVVTDTPVTDPEGLELWRCEFYGGELGKDKHGHEVEGDCMDWERLEMENRDLLSALARLRGVRKK